MPVSRGEIAGKTLRILMKTALTPGFYTESSMNDAIQEAIDFISVEMFLTDEGWQTKIAFIDTVPNQLSIDLPPNIAMVKEVRGLYGNIYTPFIYDDGNREIQYSEDSGVQQWNYVYRIIDNALYFNPQLAEGGPKFIMLEYMGYPKTLQSDQDILEPHFDRTMQHFIIYRAASILAARIEKFAVPWKNLEMDWFKKMQEIVAKRNSQVTQIREFEGY